MKNNMKNQIFDKETTIRYCKLLYGFDVKNVFGKFSHEMQQGNLWGQDFKENWIWFVEVRLKVGFPPSVYRDLRLCDILGD